MFERIKNFLPIQTACIFTYQSKNFPLFQAKKVAFVIVLIWAVSFVAVLPTAFFTGTTDFFLPDTTIVIFHFCSEVWPQMSWHLVYSIVLMVVQVKSYFYPYFSWLGVYRYLTARTKI